MKKEIEFNIDLTGRKLTNTLQAISIIAGFILGFILLFQPEKVSDNVIMFFGVYFIIRESIELYKAGKNYLRK